MPEEILLDEEHDFKADYHLKPSVKNLFLVCVALASVTISWHTFTGFSPSGFSYGYGPSTLHLFTLALYGASEAYIFYYRILVYRAFQLTQLTKVVQWAMYLTVADSVLGIFEQFSLATGLSSFISIGIFALLIAELVMVARTKSNEVDRHFIWIKRYNWAILAGVILITILTLVLFVMVDPTAQEDLVSYDEWSANVLIVSNILGNVIPFYFLVKHALLVPSEIELE